MKVVETFDFFQIFFENFSVIAVTIIIESLNNYYKIIYKL